MDEKDFELLEVLDETRNITHAADKLYMTQSALSKRIKSMEQELGVEILLRSRQGIRFTPAGEKVLEHSRAALKQMEQLRRGLDAMQGEVCGTLKAGVSVNFSYYRLPEVLTEYPKKYPRVRLDIAQPPPLPADAGRYAGHCGAAGRVPLGRHSVPPLARGYLPDLCPGV